MSEEAADQVQNAAGPDEAKAQALLDAANRASERVAGLHLAFMAVCAYVLAIVFSTTDLDLLLDKAVRLPVVNVDVPLVGFYAVAPFIVVLVHFNLLLQLQLLSRKLFAFE
ncbi:MAG: pentapeptide repeat-containing protein, partial [Deltaproteobacteria bacterium]